MNAYELAKEGMEVHSSMPNSPEYQICKAFIEQANRITELEKEVKELKFYIQWIEGGDKTISPIGYVDCTDYQNLYDGKILECILRNTHSNDDTDVALFANLIINEKENCVITEPVAWAFMRDGDFFDAIHPEEHSRHEGSYTIPLYTHPVKQLSDEEIMNVWLDGEFYEYDKEDNFRAKDFARAIIKEITK